MESCNLACTVFILLYNIITKNGMKNTSAGNIYQYLKEKVPVHFVCLANLNMLHNSSSEKPREK